MRINAEWRDVFPKLDLHDGYIGDTVPTCVDLPARRFLRKGAHYEYLGQTPTPRHQGGGHGTVTIAAGSALHPLLCGAPASSPCQFPREVILASNLACHGIECSVDTIRVVAVADTYGTNTTMYYEYVPPPCVSLQFYTNATQIKGPWDRVMCADPLATAAGTACCDAADTSNLKALPLCSYRKEKVTLATAMRRCAAASKFVCERHNCAQPDQFCAYGSEGPPQNACVNQADHTRTWMMRSCGLQVQIDSSGMVNVVHSHPSTLGTWSDGASDTTNPETSINSHNTFRVRWRGGAYPVVGVSHCSNATAACVSHGATCLCDTEVHTVPVFTDHMAVPTRDQVLAQLHIGAPEPDVFDTNTYMTCNGAAALQTGVTVYARDCNSFDGTTIFKVSSSHGVVLHLANKASTVSLRSSNNSAATSSFQFRSTMVVACAFAWPTYEL
jgi:hypothetical protein